MDPKDRLRCSVFNFILIFYLSQYQSHLQVSKFVPQWELNIEHQLVKSDNSVVYHYIKVILTRVFIHMKLVMFLSEIFVHFYIYIK